MKFSIKDFFSKHDQIRRFLRIWSHLQKKSLMENLIFCAVTLKQYLRCLSECFFIEKLFLLFFKDYNSLLMLQSSQFKVNITSKIPKFIGFIKSASRFGHSKENRVFMHLYIISNIANTKKIYQSYQASTTSPSAQFSKFSLSEDTTVYWKSKLSSNVTRNKSLELVLGLNAKAYSTLLLDLLILICSFIYWESSELVP